MEPDVFKMVCADLEHKDPVSTDQFKQTLQACIIAVVADTVVDSDVMSHLVRLLLSTPSAVEDCTACIGLLGTQPKSLGLGFAQERYNQQKHTAVAFRDPY